LVAVLRLLLAILGLIVRQRFFTLKALLGAPVLRVRLVFLLAVPFLVEEPMAQQAVVQQALMAQEALGQVALVVKATTATAVIMEVLVRNGPITI